MGMIRTTTRDTMLIDASPDAVFSFLGGLRLDGVKVSKTVKEYRMVVFTTGMSLFSFGESLEVTVQPKDKGSLVVFRAQGKVPWNITANPKRIGQRIQDALSANFR
ncbi:MAG: hypothetical protein QXU18_14535 [Thermoplasmatales archaeon]